MASVLLNNLCKTFSGPKRREVEAVRDVTLEVRDGEFLVLVGPSGCGKSTTLRLIAGLEAATRGSILIDNEDVTHIPPKDRDIAMVFQNYALFPHMTVRENMGFGLKLRKYDRQVIRQRVTEVAATLGLSECLDRKPQALSGGQRQRVALGRAIVRQPKVFLFDEPLSNLDAQMRLEMRTELIQLHRRLGATMIYVTHDQAEAMTMGNRIVVMRNGTVQQVDEPMAIYRRPTNQFVAGFMGAPPMNFLSGQMDRMEEHWVFRVSPHGTTPLTDPPWSIEMSGGLPDLLLPWAGKTVVLGLRPEDLKVSPAGGGEAMKLKNHGRAQLELVEALGAEAYLHLNVLGHRLVSRTMKPEFLSRQEELELHWDETKVHFFEAESGRRIT